MSIWKFKIITIFKKKPSILLQSIQYLWNISERIHQIRKFYLKNCTHLSTDICNFAKYLHIRWIRIAYLNIVTHHNIPFCRKVGTELWISGRCYWACHVGYHCTTISLDLDACTATASPQLRCIYNFRHLHIFAHEWKFTQHHFRLYYDILLFTCDIRYDLSSGWPCRN